MSLEAFPYKKTYPTNKTAYVYSQPCIDDKNNLKNEDMGESNQDIIPTKTFSSPNNNNKFITALQNDNKPHPFETPNKFNKRVTGKNATNIFSENVQPVPVKIQSTLGNKNNPHNMKLPLYVK